MRAGLLAAVEAGLVIAAVFGLGLWQLAAVRRSLRRDREAARRGDGREGDGRGSRDPP